MPSVASSTFAPPGSATDRQVTAPAGLADGDALLVVANTDGAGTDLGISGPGTWTKLAAAPSAVPGLHAFVATDVAAADGPWTLTGATGEWIHRIAIRITDPGDVLVGGHYNGTPGSTPPNWDAAVVPSADAPADDTLCIVAGYVINGVDTDPSTTVIANTGALAARWRYVDEGPTGILEWSPSNIWADVTVERIMVAPAGGEDKTTAGQSGVTLGVAGTARKVSRSAGGVGLGLGTGDDATKTGHTAGPVEALVDVDGTGAKTTSTGGTVSLEVAVAAATLAERITSGQVDLSLDAAGTSTKHAHAAAALTLALDLAADPAKAAHVAAELGLTLDVLGAARAIVDGQVDGHVALALAVVATATKHATAIGTLGLEVGATGAGAKHTGTDGTTRLALVLAGTARPVEGPASTGQVGLALHTAGAGTKHVAVVATLDLVLGIAGRARDAGFVLPPPARIVTVTAQDRTVLAPTRPRTVDATERQRLVVKEPT